MDDRTHEEIAEYIGDREDGPLFLSPDGLRLDPHRSLICWRRSVSLAMVDLEWPPDEPRDMMLEYLVHITLMSGKVKIVLGGPKSGKSQPGPEKSAARRKKAELVARIADEIRQGWATRMSGVDQHALRKTHRTWSLMGGVPEILIDRQLGHTSPAGDAALKVAWSLVGRKHYTDMAFLAVDAKQSAEAVRAVIDRAEAELHEVAARGETALVSPPDERRRAATGV